MVDDAVDKASKMTGRGCDHATMRAETASQYGEALDIAPHDDGDADALHEFGSLVVHPNADSWGGLADQTVLLKGRDVTIGRSPDCTISLPHDFLVSRSHAIISYRKGGYVLSDAGSYNGTTLNNALITGERPLCDGDIIRIGNCEIIYSQPVCAQTRDEKSPE